MTDSSLYRVDPRLSLEHFQAVLASLGVKASAAKIHEALILAWSEPQRAYHTLQHLRECLGLLDAWGASLNAEYRALVELALWFHDAVYIPIGDGNEEASARLAYQTLGEVGLAMFLRNVVAVLVRATNHRVTAARGPDVDLLLDIDLAILGANPSRFKEYDEQVRAEYAWIPEDVYARARLDVLGGFKKRAKGEAAPLYRTPQGQALIPQVLENLAGIPG